MPAEGDIAIEARDLYHIYRGRELETIALRGADLSLGRGSWTSLMGPSGSGKSTLLHVMAGLLEPSGGSGLLLRDDLTRPPPPGGAPPPKTGARVVLQRGDPPPRLAPPRALPPP